MPYSFKYQDLEIFSNHFREEWVRNYIYATILETYNFHINYNGERIGHFNITSFPGSGEIVVIRETYLEKEWRGTEVGDMFREAKQAFALHLRYKAMCCTVRKDNNAGIRNALKSGYVLSGETPDCFFYFKSLPPLSLGDFV
jgi:hypothetical protein